MKINCHKKPLARKHDFPGNIRELKNLVERCVFMSSGNTIEKEDVEKHMDIPVSKNEASNLGKTLDQIEKEAILEAMNMYNGNVSRVARVLGLSRGALYRRFEKHKIPYEH